MDKRSKVYLTGSQVRKRYGDISEMALWRWLRDGKMNFPQPDLILNGRRLWNEETLDAFDARVSAEREAA